MTNERRSRSGAFYAQTCEEYIKKSITKQSPDYKRKTQSQTVIFEEYRFEFDYEQHQEINSCTLQSKEYILKLNMLMISPDQALSQYSLDQQIFQDKNRTGNKRSRSSTCDTLIFQQNSMFLDIDFYFQSANFPDLEHDVHFHFWILNSMNSPQTEFFQENYYHRFDSVIIMNNQDKALEQVSMKQIFDSIKKYNQKCTIFRYDTFESVQNFIIMILQRSFDDSPKRSPDYQQNFSQQDDQDELISINLWNIMEKVASKKSSKFKFN